jgi:hypothetical protein
VTGTANVKTCRQPAHCHRLESHWKAAWAGSGPGFPHSVIRASAPRVRRTRTMSSGVSRAPTGIDASMVTVFIGRRFEFRPLASRAFPGFECVHGWIEGLHVSTAGAHTAGLADCQTPVAESRARSKTPTTLPGEWATAWGLMGMMEWRDE